MIIGQIDEHAHLQQLEGGGGVVEAFQLELGPRVQGWKFCIFRERRSEPKKIKEPKKLEVKRGEREKEKRRGKKEKRG